MKMAKIDVSVAILLIGISLVGVGVVSASDEVGGVTEGKVNYNGIEMIKHFNESNESNETLGGYIYRVYPNGTRTIEPCNGSKRSHFDNISNVTHQSHYVENWNTTPSPSAAPTSDAPSTPSATAQHESSQIPGFHVGLAVGMLLVSYLMHKKRCK